MVFALDTAWWQDSRVPASDAIWQAVGIVRAVSDPPHLLPTPRDALGPFCAVTVKRVGGPVIAATMVPFANIGRWYRDGASKPDRHSRAFSYAVWLQDGTDPGLAEGAKGHRAFRPMWDE